MITIPGYQIIKKIQVISGNTVIYRGVREQDQKSVFLKILVAEYPTLEEIARLKHEYEITHSLDIAGIVKPLGWENYQNSLALILEDFGGQTLKNFILHKKIDFTEFLKIAILLTSTLAELHKNQIIHKDIKPSNIIINPETGQVKITNFSISSHLPKENLKISNPNFLEGTLAYMSPEQTGRMNRAIDYRTDFYSLGTTFYEMLTGQLPCSTEDPLELVYCHIAKTPIVPHELNPAVSPVVSDLVMKLLGKMAEDRYQSANGILADLEQVATQVAITGKVETFCIAIQNTYCWKPKQHEYWGKI